MSLDRRSVLRGAAAGATGVGFAAVGTVPTLAQATPAPQHTPYPVNRPFPPLVDDPKGLLALPPGFKYTVVTSAGETKLKTGQPTPGSHDGNAVFNDGRNYLLIQNHEIGGNNALGVPQIEGTVYDPGVGAAGGCTVISVDRDGRNRGEWVGISGTLTNCAGGHTPWGTWLTCEETEGKANGTTRLKDHGYVFEVWADGETAHPVPLKALGRYAHEALAVDKSRTHIYLSEDASGPNGLFYRWSAPAGYRLGAQSWKDLANVDFGTYEAMAILGDDGKPIPDVAYLTSAQLLRPFRVAWVPVPDRDAVSVSCRKQLADGTVTRGKKFEGVFGTDEGVYVVNSYAKSGTSDLPTDAVPHDGMVWFYSYKAKTIQLVTYFPENAAADKGDAAKYFDYNFDGPDNVTVTPWGSLVLAEDGNASSHILSSTPGGPTYAIARNMLNDSEFCGPAFSADGRILFVNIQDPGLTLAITGPWHTYLA
ncbi:PhoX family protein [Kribbella sp. NBC_01245]|uniref:alkaline phosphatase PhoX n=1 Tax=Kribbella sp. NBC_01245 TaxID=2903578 RepID=UPI002E294C7C|nr:alkaline phosphatase PhoX [Kribbella sp. NBC_01245]